MSPEQQVASREEWLEARRALLAEEKAWTRERDRLAAKRRALPWVSITKDYVFQGEHGPVTLAELFDGRSQLLIYHFMFGPGWEEGCTGCSFLADQIEGALMHLTHHDVSFAAVSRAPVAKLLAYRARMGWRFPWVSAADSDFNFDFHVSFPDGTREGGVFYNFEQQPDPEIDELSGTSAFFQDADGSIFHSYSAFARGDETLLNAYGMLDMMPKGRNETRRGNLMDWVRRHDRYPHEERSTRG
jgi:predicted dithiol-disulfide oxidoreductase (DUF899 family)